MASLSTISTFSPLNATLLLPLKPPLLVPRRPISSYFSSISCSLRIASRSRSSERTTSFPLHSEVSDGKGLPRHVLLRASSSDSPKTALGFPTVVEILHLAVSLGVILAADYFLKRAFVAAAIKFPSSLFGMFCVFTILTTLDIFVPSAAMGLMSFFEPATLFIQRWLPLFYVPSLVVLPLAVRDVPAASGLKICFILGVSH